MELTLAERLTVCRRRRHLTLAALAAKAQCPKTAIYRLEHGLIKQPNFAQVAKLAQALGVSVEWLWLGREQSRD